MSYERPKDFKMSLSKTMEIMRIKNDLLKKTPRAFFEIRKLKTQVLSQQDPDGTEMIYNAAKGRNVLATFEKLKREVMDIHYASLFQESKRTNLMASYDISSCNTKSEVKFVVADARIGAVNIVFKLVDQPKSVLFPNKPRGKFIQLSVGKKIPPTEKLKDSFNHFMNSGGLLIDFILDTMWPIVVKVILKGIDDGKRTKNTGQKISKNKSDIANGRAVSGRNRDSKNRSASRAPRGGPQDRKNEKHNRHTRGDPIPRRNQQAGTMRANRTNYTPRFDNIGVVPPFHINSDLQMQMTAGGSFGISRNNHITPDIQPLLPMYGLIPCQQANRFDFEEGNGRRRGGGRSHHSGGGSENTDWRRGNT